MRFSQLSDWNRHLNWAAPWLKHGWQLRGDHMRIEHEQIDALLWSPHADTVVQYSHGRAASIEHVYRHLIVIMELRGIGRSVNWDQI